MSRRIHSAEKGKAVGLCMLLLAAPFLARAISLPSSSTTPPAVLCLAADWLRCFSTSSGELLWQRDDIQAPVEIAYDGDRLWVAHGQEIEGLGLADGRRLFLINNDHALFVPRAGGSLLILSDLGGWLRALDLDRNPVRERWRRRLSDGWIYPPAMDDELLYAGGSNARVTALELSSGKEIWKREVGQELVTSPLLAGGLLWVATFDARLQALDPLTGKPVAVWKLQTPLFDLQTDGRRLLGADYAGYLQAFDARSKRRLWSASVAPSQAYRFGLGSDRVAVIDPRGRILLLDADNGNLLKRIRFEPKDAGQPVLWGSRAWLFERGQPVKGAMRPGDRLRPVILSPGGES